MFLITLRICSALVVSLLATAYLTLSVCKVMVALPRMSRAQWVGFLGVLQPIRVVFKLIVKEPLIPTNANPLCVAFRIYKH